MVVYVLNSRNYRGKAMARSLKVYSDPIALGKKIIKDYREYLEDPDQTQKDFRTRTLEDFMWRLRLYQSEPDTDVPAKIMRKGTIWKLLNNIPEIQPEITKAILKGGVNEPPKKKKSFKAKVKAKANV
jgi:hypothetical protein